jgi:hypothetical protein
VREKFELEPSKDCFSDLLEINDGPFGISKNVGKFCTHDFIPKEINSTGPFIWMRFVSDSSLPLPGFKIVYRFIKQSSRPNIHYCYKQTIIPDDDSFSLNTSFLLSEFKNSTKIQGNTSIPVECVFDFYVNPELNVFLYKLRFVKPKYALDCADNFVEIYYRSAVNEMIRPKVLSNCIGICGGNESTRKDIRATVVRYMNLAWILSLMNLSQQVKQRFWIAPTIDKRLIKFKERKPEAITNRQRINKINSGKVVK